MSPKLWWQLIVVLVTLPLAGILLGWALRDPITSASGWFVSTLGLTGVFFGVFLVDAIPGLIGEPILVLAYMGGLGFWPIVAVAATASVLAGMAGWGIGVLLGRSAWVQRMFDRFRITEFMDRHGAKAVAIAAVTPFPYALTTWCAGAARVPARVVFLGALLRIPKVAIYLALILAGWNVT